MFQKLITLILWIAALILTNGCDDRATKIAREAADRQAQQNTTMAELSKEIAGGTHRLVAADAEARKEIVGVHHDLQAERTRLDTGWNALENERKQVAGQRRTASMLGPLITLVGGLVLVSVLLGFCWYALGAAHASDNQALALNGLLVREILSIDAMLLSTEDRSRPLLRQPETGSPNNERDCTQSFGSTL